MAHSRFDSVHIDANIMANPEFNIMPSWLIAALRLLAAGAAAGAGAEVAIQGIPGGLGGEGGGLALPAFQTQTPGTGWVDHHGVWHERRHRRRRRRALTASDRADIAFITGLLGPSAGSKFAAIIGAK